MHGTTTMVLQINNRKDPAGIKCHTPAVNRLSKVMGSMNSHARFINWSMRRRGRVPRIQMKTDMMASSFAKNQT